LLFQSVGTLDKPARIAVILNHHQPGVVVTRTLLSPIHIRRTEE